MDHFPEVDQLLANMIAYESVSKNQFETIDSFLIGHELVEIDA